MLAQQLERRALRGIPRPMHCVQTKSNCHPDREDSNHEESILVPASTKQTLAPYELESKLVKGGYLWDSVGDYSSVIKGDTRSLDNSSHSVRAWQS